MKREEKLALVAELKDKFAANQSFYVMDGMGMSVAQTNDFRRLCFTKGIEYKVYKNSLIQKALDQADGDYPAMDEVLKGFSGIMFSGENANLPAKLVKDFRKKAGIKLPLLKAASIERELYQGEENLTMLSELKSKNELIADVVALLQSPAMNVISALQNSRNTIAGLVKTLSEKEN